MGDDTERLRSVARAYGLSAEVVDALVAALDRRPALEPPTMAIDDRAPVALSGDPAEPSAPGPLVAGRYEDLGSIGVGGMGEVRRVRDRELNRTVAMKLVHTDLATRPAALARFLDCEGVVSDGVVAEPQARDSRDGSLRVVRGGSWLSDARVSRVADRWGSGPSFRHPDFCFRGLRRP